MDYISTQEAAVSYVRAPGFPDEKRSCEATFVMAGGYGNVSSCYFHDRKASPGYKQFM